MKKALVVDDIELNRSSVRAFLSLAGYTVNIAENPLEALKILKIDSNYSVIFTDLEMPNMNGFEFIKRVKSNEQFKSIPIIVLSSLADNETVNKVLLLGAAAHIAKPYNREKMKMALDKIVI